MQQVQDVRTGSSRSGYLERVEPLPRATAEPKHRPPTSARKRLSRAEKIFWAAANRLSPGLLSGVRLGTWIRILRENRVDVDAPYWGRALLVTLSAMANSMLSWFEDRWFLPHLKRARIQPPLFVLGLPRSGTTHLHNLLSRDSRFAYPNCFQVLFPHTFLLTEPILSRIVDWLIGRERPMDHVRFGACEPQEEEWAMSSLIGRSSLMVNSFPRRSEHYQRYLTLHALSDREREEWEAALLHLIRKLSAKYGKPMVLKSPGHTGRVRTLLKMFPEARFILIRRNPYQIFQSAWHMQRVTQGDATFQRFPPGDSIDFVLQSHRQLFEAYFTDRPLIPKGRLHELRFEELVRDPVGEIRRVYEVLNLPPFDTFAPCLQEYLASVRNYQKNRHAPLAADVKARVASEWSQLFDEWGYSR